MNALLPRVHPEIVAAARAIVRNHVIRVNARTPWSVLRKWQLMVRVAPLAFVLGVESR